MVDVHQDVSGSLLSERQVAVLKARDEGRSYADIAAALDTTADAVRVLEESARENVATAYRTVRIAESLEADVRVQADAGMRLFDVVRELRSVGDQIGVKLGSNEERLHDELRSILRDRLQGNVLERDVELTIDPDGEVGLAHSQSE